jgi:transposase
MIVIGIDAHKRSHTLVAIDTSGKALGQKTIASISTGHTDGIRWAAAKFGGDILWGVEDSRVYTRLLEHDLMAANQRVVRVPTLLMAHCRKSARAAGKSDPIDAAAVARAVLREPNLPVAHHDAVTWDLKLLLDRRQDLVYQRVATTNRLLMRLHLIDPSAPKPKRLIGPHGRTTFADFLRTYPGLCPRLALDELNDIEHFSHSIDLLTKDIGHRVLQMGSTLTEITGCGEITAAKFICGAANLDRFPHEAAFARYVGVAPIPEWSGSSRGRLRLCRAGNRALNSALHTIAVTQIRIDSPGRTYYRRRIDEGDTPAGARRCLKRKICRVVFSHLVADYRRRSPMSAVPATGGRGIDQ